MSDPDASFRPPRAPLSVRLVAAAVILMPLVELGVAILLARVIGGWWTAGAVLALTVAGVWVVRREGSDALADLRETVTRAGRGAGSGRTVDPSGATVASGPAGPTTRRDPADRALAVLAGVLMALPGLVTGTVGLVLLVPGVRGLVRRRARGRASGSVRVIRVDPYDPTEPTGPTDPAGPTGPQPPHEPKRMEGPGQ